MRDGLRGLFVGSLAVVSTLGWAISTTMDLEAQRIQIEKNIAKSSPNEKMLMRGLHLAGSVVSYSYKDQMQKISARYSSGSVLQQDFYWNDQGLFEFVETYRELRDNPENTPTPLVIFFREGRWVRDHVKDHLSPAQVRTKEYRLQSFAKRLAMFCVSPQQAFDLNNP